jgi:hypothetical protein
MLQCFRGLGSKPLGQPAKHWLQITEIQSLKAFKESALRGINELKTYLLVSACV